MGDITTALVKAVEMVLKGDSSLYEILYITAQVTLTSVLLGTLIGIPLGTLMALKNFWGKGMLKNIIFTFMGLPPVLVGLVVYLFLSRSGPLGTLELLFTTKAMIIAQTILVIPIITGLTMAGIDNVLKPVKEMAITLGANSVQIAKLILWESRKAIFAAIITGFGRVVAEVGAVMLVGGDIQGYTRVMTTAIVLETRKGNYDMALALGIILLSLSFIINILLQIFLQKGERLSVPNK